MSTCEETNLSQCLTYMSISDKLKGKKENDDLIKKNNGKNKIDFLNGYRGTLALTVVITHTCGVLGGPECKVLSIVVMGSQKYAVAGFFLLSSFLLSYRLINDFNNETSKILSIFKYFLRRFFRIYVVYCLFAYIVIYGPRFFAGYLYGKYPPILDILFLRSTGYTNLWTIPPEIMYYFLIPIICMIFFLCKKFKLIFLILCIIWIAYDQFYNILSLSSDDFVSIGRRSIQLKGHFSVFFIGSVLAMSYFLIERSERLMNLLKRDTTQKILKYSSLIIGLYGWIFHTEMFNQTLDYRFRSRPAIIWSFSLFLALLSSSSSKNPVVDFFELKFFTMCGKFSFGIYLFHPAAIQFLINNEKYYSVFGLRLTFSILFSYLLGLLFYHIVEKHLIKLADYFCKKIELFKWFQD